MQIFLYAFQITTESVHYNFENLKAPTALVNEIIIQIYIYIKLTHTKKTSF